MGARELFRTLEARSRALRLRVPRLRGSGCEWVELQRARECARPALATGQAPEAQSLEPEARSLNSGA
jgi:hypothetical protein